MKTIVMGLLLAACALAQKPDPWKPFEFLMGTWVGDGGGGPGEGGGEFSLAFDLQKKVLVRKNYAEYPAQNGRPASRHDDLMVVYLDETTGRPRAIYFDSEGHTIRYAVESQGDALVFESEPGESGPNYRLTYRPAGEKVNGKFEIRAPGEKEYKTYLDFVVRKKG